MIECPSPNHDARAGGRRPDMLILHYTGMRDADAALARLVDPGAAVSAHYLIGEEGTAYRLVAEERRAWHAGVSIWEGERDINSRSIGIELVNPGHELGYRPFPKAQITRLIALVHDILGRHAISPFHVLGHSDVAPERKTDPGELFPWEVLAAEGIGLLPNAGTPGSLSPLATDASGRAVAALKEHLAAFGYAPPPGPDYDAGTRAIVTAFQRHYRRHLVTGVADRETVAILEDLVRMKEKLS